MPTSGEVADLAVALRDRLFPTVTLWNRLEGRPRTRSFDEALRAEVRDALWMLSKQWQMGEFRGSDAGSPIFAKLLLDTTRLTKYQPADNPVEPFGYDVPIEATVERRTAGLTLDLRLVMGRYWLGLISGLGPYRQAFIDAYPFDAPDPTDRADADRCSHPEVWQLYAAVSGRAMDGGTLFTYLSSDPAHHAYDGVAGVAAADCDALDEHATNFVAWFRRLILQPSAGNDAWQPSDLDYSFAVSAPLPGGEEKVYTARHYAEQRLDWYSVDVDPAPSLAPVPGADVTGLPADAPRTMVPVPVSFAGMPNTRWWAFEDRRTNFGDIDAATTDLAKLLFLEFALVYSNDWFVIPYTLPSGAIASIKGFEVANVFGERFWITAAGSGPEDVWQRWSMFTVDAPGAREADTSLVLMPTAAKIQDGPTAEDVWLIRDEVANMVWGIERTVPLASGDSKPGLEAARQTLSFYEAELRRRVGAPPAAPPTHAPVRYQVMTTVPENWIPFIPVHVPGDNREVQLQRAALPRVLEGDPDPPVKVEPRTQLLRQGLDAPVPQPYFVHEEEVVRAGTRVVQLYQRTRWNDGQVFTWLRVRRYTGRGEGSSGLAFDQLFSAPSA